MSAAPTPSPVTGVAGTIALATTALAVVGAALYGTPTEFGIALVALTTVVAALWRWVQ